MLRSAFLRRLATLRFLLRWTQVDGRRGEWKTKAIKRARATEANDLMPDGGFLLSAEQDRAICRIEAWYRGTYRSPVFRIDGYAGSYHAPGAKNRAPCGGFCCVSH
jgi:hypothetical protein